MLQAAGLDWPRALDCSVFKEENNQLTFCMEFPEEDGDVDTLQTKPPAPTPPPVDPVSTVLSTNVCSHMRNPSAYKFINRSISTDDATENCQARCDVNNIFTSRYR